MSADNDEQVCAHMGPAKPIPMPDTITIPRRAFDRLTSAGDGMAITLLVNAGGPNAPAPIVVINWQNELAEITAAYVDQLRGCGPDTIRYGGQLWNGPNE